ncbi:Uncharacterised protein [Mycobacteroides abscessus subsp. abscessus]|nr:Uncharacterised protein [Mycobacteroides abscessus subsp. abscessus]
MPVSQELAEWAKLAGYSLTVGSEGGLTDIFWNRLGEIRLFIREMTDGWVDVTCSDRLQPEYFYFAGRTIEVVEKFLFGWFGNTTRYNSGMPPLRTPTTLAELTHGYKVATLQIDDIGRHVLVATNGSVVAIASGGKIVSTGTLVALSRYLEAPAAEIVQSFTNEYGPPLFSVRD